MIFLNKAAGSKVYVTTGQGVTTIYIQSSYGDWDGTLTNAETFGTTNSAVTSATDTTVMDNPPTSGHVRKLKSLFVRNSHATSSCDITVQHTDGSTICQLKFITLKAGQELQFIEGVGFYLFDNSTTSGRWLKTTVLTVGSGNITTTSLTTTMYARILAGGGAGGGNPATANTAGAGGSAGGYAEKTFAVSPSTAYAYVVGAKGTGVSGAAGNDGADSTVTVGGTTVTANRGKGGNLAVAAVQVFGGVAAAISTNGDVNGSSQPGGPGFSASNAALLGSGNGGSSIFGGGGLGIKVSATGTAGVGFGAGGGGSVATTAAAQVGGAGTDGLIVIDEFS